MFLYKGRVFGKDNEYRKLIITGSELDMSWNQVSHRGKQLLFQYIQHCQEQFVFNSMMSFNIDFFLLITLSGFLIYHILLIFQSSRHLVFRTSHHSQKIPVLCSSRILGIICSFVHLCRCAPCQNHPQLSFMCCPCQISLMNPRAAHSVTHWASLFN